MSMPATLQAIPVWDRFVRLFHWALVTTIVVNHFWLDDGEDIHQWLGYVAAALVGARVVWGVVGPTPARFVSFWPTPRRVMGHLRDLRAGHHPFHAGHNPLGALMMLALMALVLGLGLTGWMQSLDAFFGEEWLQELHEGLSGTLIALAGIHALAAIVMGRLERTRLVKAMVTGTKERY